MHGIQRQSLENKRIANFRGIVGTNAKVTSGRLVTSNGGYVHKIVCEAHSLHLKAAKLLLEERKITTDVLQFKYK